MSLSADQDYGDDNATVQKTIGVEVFVGGLPRSVTEGKIREVFSPCGEILDIRMIKDQKGNMKGFCFVRFAAKEAAARAVTEISGVMIDGKKIGVLPSSVQDTLYFGNLNKGWSAEEFERTVLQVFPDVESIELAMLKDASLDRKHRNRGFAFVRFSSHAAAARALRVGAQPDFRLGNLHPAVQWAEQDNEIDPKELAKIKIAFVRNLPGDADERYVKQLFEPCGKVEKVVLSKRGSLQIGFIHFAERSDLENAIRGLNDKTVQGPSGAQHKLEVEVAKPIDRSKKRGRETSESKSAVQSHSKVLKEGPGVALPKNDDIHVRRELEPADPYEDAVIALPLAVKERLLRILRLGIATRYDIDVKSLRSLRELPEALAIAVLDQFMISGAALHDKGAYLDGLISRQVDKLGFGQGLDSLPKVVETTRSEAKIYSFSHQVSSPPPPPHVGSYTPRSHSTVPREPYENYVPRYSPPLPDYNPLPSRMLSGRMEDKGPEYIVSNRSVTGSQGPPIPRMGVLDERGHSPYDATPAGLSVSYGRIGLRPEERHISPVLEPPAAPASFARRATSLSADLLAVANRPTSRPQIRFDPFTGEPYKFDPFTGEPIHPENTSTSRRF